MLASRARPHAHLLTFCRRKSIFSPWIFAWKYIIKQIEQLYGLRLVLPALLSCSRHFLRALLLNWARKRLFYLLSIATELYFGSFRRLFKLREILNCHRDVFLFNQETMVILVLGFFQGRDIVREIRDHRFLIGITNYGIGMTEVRSRSVVKSTESGIIILELLN